MEKKNVSISLDLNKAQEWYCSGNMDLKNIALQAYNRDELAQNLWQRVKTFEDACNVLSIDPNERPKYFHNARMRSHLENIYKLEIIRQALNLNYKPSLIKGDVYCPSVLLYDDYDEVLKTIGKDQSLRLCGKIQIEGRYHYLIGGACAQYFNGGLTDFYHYGITNIASGLWCCESEAIAKHMSKYFAKEIFLACYTIHDLCIVETMTEKGK